MILISKLIYNFILLPLLMIITLMGALFNKKIRTGISGRLKSINSLKEFSKQLKPFW